MPGSETKKELEHQLLFKLFILFFSALYDVDNDAEEVQLRLRDEEDLKPDEDHFQDAESMPLCVLPTLELPTPFASSSEDSSDTESEESVEKYLFMLQSLLKA